MTKMLDTPEAVHAVLERLLPVDDYSGPHMTGWAEAYGEPGYTLDDDPRAMVVLGNYWCRCDEGLRHVETHYPATWRRLEEIGVQFEWLDEWTVTYPVIDGVVTSTAYRTTANSYHWQPSTVAVDGEYLTPHDDLDTWVTWALEDPTARCIPATAYSGDDLVEAGWTRYNGKFESGWHPGQTADPATIEADIRREHGDDVRAVFAFDESSQFYMTFTAYWRESEEG